MKIYFYQIHLTIFCIFASLQTRAPLEHVCCFLDTPFLFSCGKCGHEDHTVCRLLSFFLNYIPGQHIIQFPCLIPVLDLPIVVPIILHHYDYLLVHQSNVPLYFGHRLHWFSVLVVPCPYGSCQCVYVNNTCFYYMSNQCSIFQSCLTFYMFLTIYNTLLQTHQGHSIYGIVLKLRYNAHLRLFLSIAFLYEVP